MYKTILVPIAIDHSELTARALDVGRALLDDGGQIVAMHVIEPVPGYVSQYLPPDQEATAHRHAEEVLRRETGGAEDIEHVLVQGSAGQAITDYAARRGVDLIVIASHKPGVKDYLLGSTAARVVRHARCAVHVVR